MCVRMRVFIHTYCVCARTHIPLGGEDVRFQQVLCTQGDTNVYLEAEKAFVFGQSLGVAAVMLRVCQAHPALLHLCYVVRVRLVAVAPQTV